MKEIVVISGKGGTGKTSIAVALATAMNKIVIADCDVDAADFHLIAGPEVRHEALFYGGAKAVLDCGKCEQCGVCYAKCVFDAVQYDSPNGQDVCAYSINRFACEGCGVCMALCPAGAIELVDVVNGSWYVSGTRFGTLVHARLGPGEENSGRLVTLLREKARQIALEEGLDTVLIDGSPGIGCPVIASLTGAGFALIVAEPTVSGLHDFKRVAELVKQFSIPAAVCVNKYDLNTAVARQISDVARIEGFFILENIPFDGNMIDAVVHRKSILEHGDSPAKAAVKTLCDDILKII